MTTPKGPTQDQIAALVEEAERGYDVDAILTRRRGRPSLGTKASLGVDSVRFAPDMRRALLLRATHEGVSVSEIIRRAVGEYLKAS